MLLIFLEKFNKFKLGGKENIRGYKFLLKYVDMITSISYQIQYHSQKEVKKYSSGSRTVADTT